MGAARCRKTRCHTIQRDAADALHDALQDKDAARRAMPAMLMPPLMPPMLIRCRCR
jgi:hypothetical protein